MLTIRFFRQSKRNQPAFKIVVADKRNSSTRGRFVEEVGHWNPLSKEKILNQERIKYWLSVGAQPSATVFNLLVSEKIIEGKKKIDVHKKSKKKVEAVAPVVTGATPAAPVVPAAPVASVTPPAPAASPVPAATPEPPKPVGEDMSSVALAKEEKLVEKPTQIIEEKK